MAFAIAVCDECVQLPALFLVVRSSLTLGILSLASLLRTNRSNEFAACILHSRLSHTNNLYVVIDLLTYKTRDIWQQTRS